MLHCLLGAAGGAAPSLPLLTLRWRRHAFFAAARATQVLLASQVVRMYHFGLTSRRNLTVNNGPEHSKQEPFNMAFQWLLYSIPFRLDAIGASVAAGKPALPTVL